MPDPLLPPGPVMVWPFRSKMTGPFTNVVIPMAFTPVYPKKCTMEHAPLSQLDSPNCAKGSVDPTEQLILSRPDRWNGSFPQGKPSAAGDASLPCQGRLTHKKKPPRQPR